MRGLADLIRPDWIRMFSPDELQMVISGSVQELDLNDLRSNCNYGGGYHDNHPSGLSLTFHRNPSEPSACGSTRSSLSVAAMFALALTLV